MIDKPGIYQISADAYHADCCSLPSLSSSIINLLDKRSALHAWQAHAKLNPGWQPEQRTDFDIGTAAHKLILEGGDIGALYIIDADNYRTKAAQEQRDYAYAARQTPLLRKHFDAVSAMAVATMEALVAAEKPALLSLAHGQAEQTVIWKEGLTWCRARPDWYRKDGVIADLKTTTNAEPGAWIRGHLFADGCDIQAAWYMRGLRAITGLEPTWRWVVIEREPPYAVSIIAPTPAVIVLAEKKIERALAIWRRGMSSGHWPAYGTQTAWAELPPWQEQAVLERELREEPPRADAPNILASG
jgi:hypothetical protein